MDRDGSNDLGDGREERDEVTARAGMGRTKKCFESDRMVWKCSARRCLSGPPRDVRGRELCLMKEEERGERIDGERCLPLRRKEEGGGVC